MAKKTPPVEYIPDGPIMSCLQKPQLMFVRSEKSIFMTKRKMNDEINKDWKSLPPLDDIWTSEAIDHLRGHLRNQRRDNNKHLLQKIKDYKETFRSDDQGDQDQIVEQEDRASQSILATKSRLTGKHGA